VVLGASTRPSFRGGRRARRRRGPRRRRGVWPQLLRDARDGACAAGIEPRRDRPGGSRPRRDLFAGRATALTLAQFGRAARTGASSARSAPSSRRTHRPAPPNRWSTSSRGRIGGSSSSWTTTSWPTGGSQGAFRALIPSRSAGEPGQHRHGPRPGAHGADWWRALPGNVIGFESIDADASGHGQGPNSLTSPVQAEIEVLKRHGLQTWAAFTVGHEPRQRRRPLPVLDFALRHRSRSPPSTSSCPTRTPFYERLRDEGRLLYGGRWWSIRVPLQPRGLRACPHEPESSPESRSTSGGGGTAPAPSCGGSSTFGPTCAALPDGPLLGVQPALRRETFKKQGMKFGLS